MITVIYTIRDRDPGRLRRSVQSLKKNSSIEFKVIVVDYGSRNQDEIENVCHQLSVKKLRCETEGLPWSRAHAINIGVKHSKTKYLAITDIDMLFESDILKASLAKSGHKITVHCQPLWLPKNGKKSKAKLGNRSQLGGYQFIERKAFEELNGMDERIKFWGNEDSEWSLRLRKYGYKLIWLNNDQHKMYHQWHEHLAGIFDRRPVSSESDTWTYMISNMIESQNGKASWGKNVSLKERPIIERINTHNVKDIRIDNYLDEFSELLKNFKNHHFVCLHFGDRFQKESSPDWTPPLMEMMDSKLCRRWGFKIRKRRNKNFDAWYVSIPFLKEIGLIDYYISQDMNKVYLLFDSTTSTDS